MRIRRSRLTGDFLQVPNATVRDDRLSHMARGILVELLSRPDGWEATADDMWRASAAKHGKASPGRRAFRGAFAELKEQGYLASERTILPGGLHGTTLAITDVSAGGSDVPASGTSEPPAKTGVSAGQSDVPHGGTSVRPGKTGVSAGGTGVPHAGTPEDSTDVPHGGTSVRPAETDETPAHTDVPPAGTSGRPAETGKTAGRSDVPHAGTSSYKNGLPNTGKKTSSSAAAADTPPQDEEDLTAFGAFWIVYPKSRDRPATLAAWREARAKGVPAEKITAAAQGYARERAGQDQQFTKLSANWLRDERYEDDFDDVADPNGRPPLRAVSGGYQGPFQALPASAYENDLGF